jgi:hypothetical protein
MSTTNVVKMEAGPTLDFNAPPITTSAVVLDVGAIDSISRVAEIMAAGKATIPRHLQGNRGDCFAVTMQAMQWGMNPFAVAQKTHLVNGTLGYEAQLVNAVITARAPVTGRINYEWFGDWDKIAGKFKEVPSKNEGEKRIVKDWTLKEEEGLGVRVWATFKGEDAPRELRLLLAQAGVRNSPLWGQDPKQQLAYLAVKRWSRLYCPDVILGVYTPDELEERPAARDMGRAEEVTQVPGASRTDNVRSKLAQKRGAVPNVDKILADIEAATSSAELAKAIEPVTKLASEADKEKVRAAYQEKLQRERAKAHQEAATPADDAATAGDPPAITYDELVQRFKEAENVDQLDADATLIGELPPDVQQGAITIYNDRRAELEG